MNRKKKTLFSVVGEAVRREGVRRTFLAVSVASGKILARYLSGALARARDFRQPALPGTVPGPDQDRPSLPPAVKCDTKARKMVPKPPRPMLEATDRALRRLTDWREHRLWNWVTGGGWKGLLGARRFWGTAVRYMWDGLGKIAWTFRLVAVIPLEYATRRARQMSTSIVDFRRMRDAGLLHLPLPTVRRRIFFHGVVPPMTGGVVFLVETLIFRYYSVIPVWEGLIDVIVAFGAIGVPLYFFAWCQDDLPLHLAGQKWPLQTELEKIRNSAPFLAGFGLPSFVNSSPDSYASCILYTLFGTGSGASSGSCQSPFGQMIGNSTVVAAVPPAISAVASLVSILALFILTLVYTYHVVSAMHTAAHTGDWTHEGVNAAWAPLRGSLSAAMIAAPGGLSILGGLILFVAMTGNGVGDTAASKVSSSLAQPTQAMLANPAVQGLVDNGLYSLVCAHIMDNFTDPTGAVPAVVPMIDNFGRLSFSNNSAAGPTAEYGPGVCGTYGLPYSSGMSMAGNPFTSLVQAGSPLDTVAAAIASNVNGCGSVVIGTGLSPCAPAGSPPNRQVFATGGGIADPSGGHAGALSTAEKQYLSTLMSSTTNESGTGGAAQANSVGQDGWEVLGEYYLTMGSMSNQWAKFTQTLPSPHSFDMTSIAGSEAVGELENAIDLTRIYIDRFGFSGAAGGASTDPWWITAPASGTPTDQLVASTLSTVVDPKTNQVVSFPDYLAGDGTGDPLARFQNLVEEADTSLLGVGSVAAGVIGTATGLLGKYMGKGAESDVEKAAAASGIEGKNQGAGTLFGYTKIVGPLLAALTFAAGYYLPFVPLLGVAMFFLFWIVEVMVMALFAPIWALAVGIPQGDGFIGQHGRDGMFRLADIAIRPVLMVGMFGISLALFVISSDLFLLLGKAMADGQGANGTAPAGFWYSLVGALAWYIIYGILLWRAMHFAFELIHTGPYFALRLLGIDGEKGREGREGEEFKQMGSTIFRNVGSAVGGFRTGRAVDPVRS